MRSLEEEELERAVEEVLLKELKKGRTVYPSRIAFEYDLPYKLVYKVAKKLLEEGKAVKVARVKKR